MYCTMCGRLMQHEGVICKECSIIRAQRNAQSVQETEQVNEQEKVQAQETTVNVEPVNVQPTAQPQAPKGSMTAGLKKSIIALILPTICAIAFIIMLEIVAFAMLPSGGFYGTYMVYVVLFLSAGVIVGACIGLKMSMDSLKFVNDTVKRGERRPIPTMICSIVGIVENASAILGFTYMTFMFLFAGISLLV